MDVPRPSTEINLTKDFLRFKTGGMVGIGHLTRPLEIFNLTVKLTLHELTP